MKTGSAPVGADYISARTRCVVIRAPVAPAAGQGAYAMRPYGEFEGRFVGADAHIGPLGIDAYGTPAERSYSYNRNHI